AQLKLPGLFGYFSGGEDAQQIKPHPLPWIVEILNGVEHANFFETRATEYSKGATRGEWNNVWSSFDNRKKAKANDDTVPVITAETDGEDMFAKAGIAAE
ncbi:MAG: hypothetical protein ACK4GG_10650, partial [Sphingomonas sp.]